MLELTSIVINVYLQYIILAEHRSPEQGCIVVINVDVAFRSTECIYHNIVVACTICL